RRRWATRRWLSSLPRSGTHVFAPRFARPVDDAPEQHVEDDPMTDTKTAKVEKTDAEWRRELTPMQYAVLREKATERPFSGEYEHEHRDGTYVCAGCGQTLFESDA